MKATSIYFKPAIIGLSIFNFLFLTHLHAQVGINSSAANPNASAILDLNTGNSGHLGFLGPQVSLVSNTDVATIPTPATGLLVYNTNAAMTSGNGIGYYYWNGAAWAIISGTAGGWQLTGNAGTNPGTNFIGTTDNKDLYFEVNSTEAGFLDILKFNTAWGVGALLPNSGIDNTATGFTALFSNTTGTDNTAAGYEALNNNTTGTFNTAIGSNTLFSNTTGGSNIAIGNQALASNTTGLNNLSIGNQALSASTVADGNLAIGNEALKANTGGAGNSAVGFQALFGNTSGSNNTAEGTFALTGSTIGNDNTGIGYNALLTNTTGSDNTALGYGADVASGILTNATAIGFNTIAPNSNSTEIGTASVLFCGINGAVYNAADALRVGTAGTNGNGASLTVGGAWTNASDRNKKENFSTPGANDILNKVCALPVLRWNYKNETATVQHIGPMAQDFYKAFHVGSDSLSISTIDPAGIALVAIKALNDKLETENQALKVQLDKQASAQAEINKATEKEISGLKQLIYSSTHLQANVK